MKEGSKTKPPLSAEMKNLREKIRTLEDSENKRREAEEALRKSEEQLRQWQRVEAIGRLAGGVAHDFNNLLMTILGCSELLLRDFDPADPRRGEVEEIRRAAQRATSLTHQLLAFGRRQVLQPRVLDLNEIVENMNRMLRRMIGEDIQFLTVLTPGLWPVKVDPGQIEQVIMNLVVNARDAMPEGGRLTLETANLKLDEEYARRHIAVKPGPFVMLAVTDTGCGMDAETRSHLFEPFFTTKEKDKGTGLGLSTVYGIIKQSGGNIWAYSEVGKGSAFKVYLPRAAEPVKGYKPKDITPGVAKGTETILLVEDEEAVRILISRVLQGSGYTVLEAGQGKEALDVCRKHSGPIHLLVTDVIMPQMSGRELAERLALVRPETKVLFMSGYPDNAIVHHGVLDPGTAFLQKPFTLTALENKVREVLEPGSGGKK
jgi:signal transduction histidine kinase